MNVKLTFLGTGTSQGVPVIACDCEVCSSADTKDKRLRSSVLVETNGKAIVIDTGPDFRQQMLRCGIRKLDAVLFTHEHKDHTAGLDDVRAFNFKWKMDMQVYATQHVQEALKREYQYIFNEVDYPGLPKVNLNTITNTPFNVCGINVIPIEVLHYKLPVFGFRIGDLSYITDANKINNEELHKIKGSKILILNALRNQSHLSHFNLQEALEVMDIIKPDKGYLTHISHYLGKHAEVSESLPDYVELSYDGLEVVV